LDYNNYFLPEYEIALNPLWIVGFTEAEGSFGLSITKDTSRKCGWRVKPSFEINLHIRDAGVLEISLELEKFSSNLKEKMGREELYIKFNL
jgi:hypothetical protein